MRALKLPLTINAPMHRQNIANLPAIIDLAVNLAAQRLAPVQCSSWGHPETSGFPTIDYFLSSELMEPRNGKDHYSEELVLLPNLSVYLEPAEIPTQAFSMQLESRHKE